MVATASKCLHCQAEFTPRKWFRKYCSVSCKNPKNRKGTVPWNKGIKGRQPYHNTEGLKLGWGREIPQHERDALAERMRANNPNHNGAVNKKRAKYRSKDDPFSIYKYEVWKYTRRSESLMEIPEERGKYNGCLQLDHIVPFEQGFKLGIDPKIMGSQENLQWLTQEENRRKSDTWQSQETVDSLLHGKEETV